MNNCNIRLATRGIILRKDGKIALQNKSNKNEYKYEILQKYSN